MAEAYKTSHPKLVEFLTENLMNVITFLSFLKSHPKNAEEEFTERF